MICERDVVEVCPWVNWGELGCLQAVCKVFLWTGRQAGSESASVFGQGHLHVLYSHICPIILVWKNKTSPFLNCWKLTFCAAYPALAWKWIISETGVAACGEVSVLCCCRVESNKNSLNMNWFYTYTASPWLYAVWSLGWLKRSCISIYSQLLA